MARVNQQVVRKFIVCDVPTCQKQAETFDDELPMGWLVVEAHAPMLGHFSAEYCGLLCLQGDILGSDPLQISARTYELKNGT